MGFKTYSKGIDSQINEVSMSKTTLDAFLTSPEAEGILFGFEAEMIFADVFSGNDVVDEFKEDEEINVETLSQIFDWFEYVSGSAVKRVRASYKDYIASVKETYVTNHLDDKMQELYDIHMEDNPDDKHSAPRDFRDDAESELEDQFDAEEDVSVDDWLRDDLGIGTYYEFAEEFDIQTPTNPYYNGERDNDFNIDIAEGIVDEIESAIDGVVFAPVRAGYHATKRDNIRWIIEPDGSLEPQSESDMGGEIISPPMPLAEGLEMLSELLAWARANGHYASKAASTGLHLNISIPDQRSKDVDYLKLVLLSGDEHVLEIFDRVGGYNEASMTEVRKNIENGQIDHALQTLRKGLVTDAAASIITGNTDRNVTVNMKKDYIEFRTAGHDYIDMVPEIRQTVLRYARALVIASDPEAYKKEYQKKLAKLIIDIKSKMKMELAPEAVDLFVAYASGDKSLAYGSKSALKDKLKSGASRERAPLPDRKDSVANASLAALKRRKAALNFMNYSGGADFYGSFLMGDPEVQKEFAKDKDSANRAKQIIAKNFYEFASSLTKSDVEIKRAFEKYSTTQYARPDIAAGFMPYDLIPTMYIDKQMQNIVGYRPYLNVREDLVRYWLAQK